MWNTTIKTTDFIEYGLDETCGDTVNADGYFDYQHHCILEGLQPEKSLLY